MVSVKFICYQCGKAHHIDELDYVKSLNTYSCSGETCENISFIIKRLD